MPSSAKESASNPFNAWWWVSGGFLVFLVVAVVLVLIFGEDEPEDLATAIPPATPSASAPTEVEGDEVTTGACDLPAESQAIPTEAPEASWTNVQYFLVPESPTNGPVASSGLWPCFAHTPTGALFASVHFFAGLGEPDYEAFAAEAAVQNGALDTWLAAQDPETRRQEPGQVAQVAAFQFQQVEPNNAVVTLGLRQEGYEFGFRIAMTWDEESGNWKGDLSASQLEPALVDLSTYTPWSGSDG